MNIRKCIFATSVYQIYFSDRSRLTNCLICYKHAISNSFRVIEKLVIPKRVNIYVEIENKEIFSHALSGWIQYKPDVVIERSKEKVS